MSPLMRVAPDSVATATPLIVNEAERRPRIWSSESVLPSVGRTTTSIHRTAFKASNITDTPATTESRATVGPLASSANSSAVLALPSESFTKPAASRMR